MAILPETSMRRAIECMEQLERLESLGLNDSQAYAVTLEWARYYLGRVERPTSGHWRDVTFKAVGPEQFEVTLYPSMHQNSPPVPDATAGD